MPRLEGLLPPVVTPLRDGEVDQESIARLVEHLAPHLDGMIICGSVGEGPSLGAAARREATEGFVAAAAGRLRVIVGVAGTSLADVIGLVADADPSVDGFLVPPPYYFTAIPHGVRAFYREVAAATDREVVVYDNPATTGTVMSADDLVTLAEESANINHVKVTDPDLAKVVEVAAMSDVTLLAGSDEVMHHQIVRGCVGAATGCPQVYPALARRWFDAARAGDWIAARSEYDRIAPFIVELLQWPNQYPMVLKSALAYLGVLRDDAVLPPLVALDDTRRQEVATVLDLHPADGRP